MSDIRDRIVTEARSYLGTRFRHQGRLKNIGVDCVGVIVGVAKTLKLANHDETGYARRPDGHHLRHVFTKHMIEIALDVVLPGDVLMFQFNGDPQHVGFVTQINPTYLIHAWAEMRKVTEHRLDSVWKKRIVAAFRFKGM
ncbi:NlpC/P60 family protein [Magnetococcales bacterium HHB-1]